MKNKELIEKLKKEDPEKDVKLFIEDGVSEIQFGKVLGIEYILDIDSITYDHESEEILLEVRRR